MDTTEIIAQIDAEISRLQQAKSLLSGTTTTTKLGRPKAGQASPRARSGGSANSGRSQHEPFVVKQHPAVQESAVKRTMSPEGRARIAAAQKARWAKAKKAAKKAA